MNTTETRGGGVNAVPATAAKDSHDRHVDPARSTCTPAPTTCEVLILTSHRDPGHVCGQPAIAEATAACVHEHLERCRICSRCLHPQTIEPRYCAPCYRATRRQVPVQIVDVDDLLELP
jgi:hypothetical protein